MARPKPSRVCGDNTARPFHPFLQAAAGLVCPASL